MYTFVWDISFVSYNFFLKNVDTSYLHKLTQDCFIGIPTFFWV